MAYNNDEFENYIVKIPKPKKGEKVSTGGLRKDGQMVAQYYDPVLYQEPEYICKSNGQVQLEKMLIDAGSELLYIGWEEFGEPIVRSTLSMLKNKVVARISNMTLQPKAMKYKDYEIIDINKENIIEIPFDQAV